MTLAFERDGTFVLDVSNDPAWLKLRMERFNGNFIDRVVLFVDDREVRPQSAHYLAPRTDDGLATYRLRGRMPADARTLRWYYGLVADPYPLKIRRADGRVEAEQVGGDAWSRPIDLSGQFASPLRASLERQLPIGGMLTAFFGALALRWSASRRHELL